MANAGISVELRQQITGHSSAEMNAIYTHHELQQLKSAINAIPGVKLHKSPQKDL